MAKFLEYLGKEWLAKGGLSVPKGRVASSPAEAEEVARWIGGPVAVKGQVQAGGRGKAGIIKLADTPEQAKALAAEILAKTVKGLPVKQVLVEEKIDIKKEFSWIKESDWKSYWSSSPTIKEMIAQDGGTHNFSREILNFCYSKSSLLYCEEFALYFYGALESEDFLNSNIRSKIYKNWALGKQDIAEFREFLFNQ